MDVAFSGLAKPMIGTFNEADAFHQDASELLRSVADEPLGRAQSRWQRSRSVRPAQVGLTGPSSRWLNLTCARLP